MLSFDCGFNVLTRSNQLSLIEAPQISWLFDGLENGNLEEDLSDGTVVENCDYAIAS